MAEEEIPAINSEVEKKVLMVELYWYYQKSLDRVRGRFRELFGRALIPDNKTILRNVQKFSQFGTVLNRSRGNSGRPASVVTPDNLAIVDTHIEENPETSERRASLELSIRRTSLQRIEKKLKLYPYKIQIYQELTQWDMDRRDQFSFRMLRMISNGAIDPNKIWFSDEAHFWLSGYVNKQNYRFWAKENPRIVRTTTMKPQRITVWCAICAEGIIGPFFFEGNVTGESYKKMLETEFIPVAQGLGLIDGYWFMQDGARPHRTREVFDLLNEHFNDRVLGLEYESRFNKGLEWPPNSPDLNACDFFLWGDLKDKVYKTAPRSLEEIKSRVEAEIRAITKEQLKEVMRHFKDRLQAVSDMDGGHIEQYMH